MSRAPKVGRSKYNVRTDAVGKANRTVDGFLFDSLKEAKRYSELKMLERAGEITALALQPSYDLWVNDMKVCRYRADFTYVTLVNGIAGVSVVEDCKGFKTPEYKLKKKLMRAIYGIEVKEV